VPLYCDGQFIFVWRLIANKDSAAISDKVHVSCLALLQRTHQVLFKRYARQQQQQQQQQQQDIAFCI